MSCVWGRFAGSEMGDYWVLAGGGVVVHDPEILSTALVETPKAS